MDPWRLGKALWRLTLLTLLMAIGPVAFDAHLMGFLAPTSGTIRKDLKGFMTAWACRFLHSIHLRGNGDGVWLRFILLLEGRDSGE